VGHVRLLSASRQFGDVLIVAVDDDDSVRRLKGEGRPVISERERVRILSALDSVDFIVPFATEQLNHLIETIRPDVLTKGSNYTTQEVVGGEKIEQLGGRVVLVPVLENVSTTEILKTIRNQ
jgi:D-beta-D-heptose 7-phosphate kinase/D-beta-D-heptose 1-phosphate adenosyltransferase